MTNSKQNSSSKPKQNSSPRLLFLGTGGSMGVPVMGCHCDVCESTSPYNKRLRPSALLQVNHKNILIDSGPDIRTQMLREKIDHINGVIITHAHHDHTAGIDDIRVFNMWSGHAMPCLLSRETFDELKPRYNYIFSNNNSNKNSNTYITNSDTHTNSDNQNKSDTHTNSDTHSKHKLVSKIDIQLFPSQRGEIEFLSLPFKYFTYEQGGMAVNGFRVGNLAFVSDIREYPETIFEDLKGVEIIVISALKSEPSRLHFSIDEAIAFVNRAGISKAWLTHIAHEVEHSKVNESLPSNIQLAYDGLSIEFKMV